MAKQPDESKGSKGSQRGSSEEREQQESGQERGLLARIAGAFSSPSDSDSDAEPKATDMLKEDHERVRSLFRDFEAQGERAHQRKKAIVEKVSDELEVHAQIEEKIFYQAFRSVPDKDGKKIVRESFEEHLIVKRLLTELAAMEPSDEQFDAKVTVLKEVVEHHAKEEEDDLFPAAEGDFGDERLREIGREMAALKQQLQRRTA